MTAFRTAIPDFQLANPIYAGASVSFFTVDVNGVATATLATLYANPTGATTTRNPQILDADGKLTAPVYISAPVIAEAVGPNVASHSTGLIGLDPDILALSDLFFQRPEAGSVSLSMPSIMRLAPRVTDFSGLGLDTANVTIGFQAALSAGLRELVLPQNRLYSVTNLNIPAALRLIFERDARIQMRTGGTGKLLTLGANKITLEGPGIIDCNGCGATNDVAGTEPIFCQARDDIVIDGLNVLNSQNYGIHLDHGSRITVRRTRVERTVFSAIIQYFYTASVEDIAFIENVVDRTDTAYDPLGNGGGIGHFATSAVPSNGFTALRTKAKDNIILGKVGGSGTGTGIELFANGAQYPAFTDPEVDGNYTRGASFGISVTNSFGAQTNDNHSKDARVVGIEVSACARSQANDNLIEGPATGILTGSSVTNPSANNLYSGNEIYGTTTNGISIGTDSDRAHVIGNIIKVAGGNGITDAATNTTHASNKIDGANVGSTGIALTGGSGRRLLFNDIERFTTKIGGQDATDTVIDVTTEFGLPRGRLTLTSVTPVLTASVLAATTIYYTPYVVGNLVPIYNGTNFNNVVFAELSNITSNSATGKAGPAAVANNSNYDLFVWLNSGAATLTRGPAWTSDTGRGTGAGTSELQRVNGIQTNKVAITNGPGANLGTYVGTVRSNGSAQIDFQVGASAAGGTAAILGVWNAYNRVMHHAAVQDSTASWSYGTNTWRAADNSNGNRISAVVGLNEDSIDVRYAVRSASAGNGYLGIGVNSTTAPTGLITVASATNAGVCTNYRAKPGLGFNYFQALEKADAATTWIGAGEQELSAMLMM